MGMVKIRCKLSQRIFHHQHLPYNIVVAEGNECGKKCGQSASFHSARWRSLSKTQTTNQLLTLIDVPTHIQIYHSDQVMSTIYPVDV